MKNRIYPSKPHIQSRAALILLKHNYAMREYGMWTEVRQEFLLSRMTKDSGLICEYCSKPGLLLTGEPSEYKMVATIDHVHPVSKGGPKFEQSNFKVACFKCNKEKGDKYNT